MIKKITVFIFTFSLFLFTITSNSQINAASSPKIPGGSSPKEPCPNGICDTAIGQIQAQDPFQFITRIFSIVLSLAALAAVILIIYSGYKLLTSRGNKESIQGARETITSAIVGLLFIVFSLVILSVIAGDILKIPGFG